MKEPKKNSPVQKCLNIKTILNFQSASLKVVCKRVLLNFNTLL